MAVSFAYAGLLTGNTFLQAGKMTLFLSGLLPNPPLLPGVKVTSHGSPPYALTHGDVMTETIVLAVWAKTVDFYYGILT
jgi:hypothetical protein